MLEARNLTKRYGDLVAADDVSITVFPGQMIGFIGGNGAGKTTTMRMIMGLLTPDSGETYWHGKPLTAADRSRFGYMPEERGLYPKQKVLDQLVYLGELHGMTAADARSTATELLTAFGLGERLTAKLEELSLGNQQRVQVTASVMHSPIALILDEPFSGLDPAAVEAMSNVLKERTADGVPVLFSSHQLDLIERLCDGLVILDHGRVVLAGDADDLRAQGGVKHRLVATPDVGWVRDMAGVEVIDVDGPTAIIRVADDAVEQRVLAEAMARGELREFSPIRASLNEIYQEVTK